jgi:hypothetical protein
MLGERDTNEAYITLLDELEEAILIWQKKQKEVRKDKRFSAKKFLAKKLGYKDENVIYRFLDPYDMSKAKMGIEDVQIISETINDFNPLKNFIESLETESKG